MVHFLVISTLSVAFAAFQFYNVKFMVRQLVLLKAMGASVCLQLTIEVNIVLGGTGLTLVFEVVSIPVGLSNKVVTIVR